jgi:acyl-CoA reductase-like NAD-dependent aldehyde dehydrogenase
MTAVQDETGTKQSGLGRRNSVDGFREYLEIKTLGFPAA